MASIIKDYEYDIFISYRQKDNKYDGWVTEFVDNMKRELEATFKENVSVYFDINPHDGLLETHDVDASLKEKLKCLIFIPIISQTYCDPQSFAWQNEFVAFNKMAKEDLFGRDIRLAGGNVASRILPVKIHDLDEEDKILLENELGGVLRGIEFIFKSSGVNRPLNPSDNPDKNFNKTYYRDQVNKVANAVKEIIAAIKKHNQQDVKVTKDDVNIKTNPQKNLKTKIIITSVIILALIVLGYFLIPIFSKPKVQLEKSIAVLPFRNDSPNDSTTYFLNGVMEEILNNLQKISDFRRVLSRNSVEQFRNNTTKSTPEIAKALGVNYIVEGSGQKYGNSYRLRVQLIAAKNERHLWGESYEKEIRETKDIFGTQSEIAQSIASALKATITPKEKQLIEKTPTKNLTAYDFYQRGREEYTKYWLNNSNKAALQKAEDLYRKALKYDSTFAQACTGLARVYWDKNYGSEKEYFSENFMDSVLILTNIALSFDNQFSEAYTLKGTYYSEIGKPEQAIEEFDKAIKLNPNDWKAYYEKGEFYFADDLVNTINYLQKAASINRGAELPSLLGEIGSAYIWAGFPEKAKRYYQDKLKLDGDSVAYYAALGWVEFCNANINKAIEFEEKGYAIDSTDIGILYSLGFHYPWLGQYKESLKYYKRWFESLKIHRELNVNSMQRIGYAYWQNGYKKEAENFFNEQIKYCNRMNELKRTTWGQGLYTYYDLAGVYAFRGEKDKAYKNLRIFNQSQRINLFIAMLMKTDPLFNSIRNEPEFQQIAKEIEAKYQAEHERVKKWLEENGML
jgi:TolB-like protein/Tfp pilus assembly protein PilF